KGRAMTFFEKDFVPDPIDAEETAVAHATIADPKRAPETMGGCSYAGCGCSAYVRSYNGDCASCDHPANAHW
ncbi:MAG: hypothetical protein ABL931_19950, partial [Usitatibacteraceae bacterium]